MSEETVMEGQGEGTLEVAERFFQAVSAGDIEAVKEIYAPDAVIWHNTDGQEQSVQENLRILGWMARALPGRRYEVLRREAIGGGFLQQHVLRAPLPDGSAFAMPACIICRVENGRITRLDEYLDSAHTAPLAALAENRRAS